MPLPQKRSYHSESRQAQAQKTKNQILASAKKLFEAHGFDKVTINQIAEHAQVSAPSVYALFQSKSGLLQALIDSALAPTHLEALVQKAKKEKSPISLLKITATIARQIYDAENAQLGSLPNTSILDPVLKKLEKERERRRYSRLENSVNTLFKEKAVVQELTIEKSRDILWALTGRDLYRMLVIEQQWSPDEYEQWLGNTLVKLLLK